MKCPICKAKIDELDEICPNCKTNFDDYEKEKRIQQRKNEEHKEEKNNKKTVWVAIIIGIIILIPFVCMLFDGQKELDKAKLEGKLLQEGKIVTAKEVTEKFKENLKNKNYDKIKNYLSDDYRIYYNLEQKYNLESFLGNLEKYEEASMEKRGNSVAGEETYRIYWNGWKYEDSSQIIDLFMKKNVKEDEIVYEIYMIRLTDNNI